MIHNHEVLGSIPSPATKKRSEKTSFLLLLKIERKDYHLTGTFVQALGELQQGLINEVGTVVHDDVA